MAGVRALLTPVLLGLLLSLLGHSTSACKLAWNGNSVCSKGNCSRLMGNVDHADSPVVTGASMSLSSPGGLNYRFFATLVMGDFAGSTSTYRQFFFLDQIKANYVQDCCTTCAQTGGCYMFRHFPIKKDDIPDADAAMTQLIYNAGVTKPSGGWPVIYPTPYPPKPSSSYGNWDGYDPTGAKGNCILFGLSSKNYATKAGVACTQGTPGCFYQPNSKTGAGGVFTVDPTTGLVADVDTTTKLPKPGVTGRPRSYWGGICNGESSVNDDPHFVGGDGVRFDFNGKVGKSFCLITDSSLHVNMELGGYEDRRLSASASQVENAHNIRSWITGLNFMWKDEAGQKHSLLLRTRKGVEENRGAGFISLMLVDGQEIRVPSEVGEKVEVTGMVLTMEAQGKHGPYDMDTFSLKLGNMLQATISTRVAHPLLRTPDEAYAHFNIKVTEFSASPEVHGVLGQTFRHDISRSVKALEYRLLSRLLQSQMHADGPSGLGYLDGGVSDYVTSDVTSPDCKFASAWN